MDGAIVVRGVYYLQHARPSGFSPRDLDSRWSLGIGLERYLQPFQVMDFEPISEWATHLFTQYKKVRELVIRHVASSSYDRIAFA